MVCCNPLKKKVINMKTVVSFRDLSYDKKRQKYREYSINNGFAYEMKLFVLDTILKGKKKDILPGLDIEMVINNLLVDGYVAYERVFDVKQENRIDYVAIDPVTLITSIDNGKNIWIQYNDNPNMRRFLTEDQILYMTYPIMNANDSLIGQLFTKQIKLYNSDMLNDFMLTYICDKVREYITDIIHQERNFFKK